MAKMGTVLVLVINRTPPASISRAPILVLTTVIRTTTRGRTDIRKCHHLSNWSLWITASWKHHTATTQITACKVTLLKALTRLTWLKCTKGTLRPHWQTSQEFYITSRKIKMGLSRYKPVGTIRDPSIDTPSSQCPKEGAKMARLTSKGWLISARIATWSLVWSSNRSKGPPKETS